MELDNKWRSLNIHLHTINSLLETGCLLWWIACLHSLWCAE